MTNHRRSFVPTSSTAPVGFPVEDELANKPSSTAGFSYIFNDCNFIGAGLNNSVVDSRNCSIINGTENYISGKYNCHIIGDYIGIGGLTDVRDNSFHVGCYNGMDVWGQLSIKRGGLEIAGGGGGQASYAIIDLKNDKNKDFDIRIQQGDSNNQPENDLYIFSPSAYSDDSSTPLTNLHVHGDVIAYTFSDQRIKDDIEILPDCLDKILAVDAVQFNWSDKQNTYVGHDIGLIAQQVQSIAPEIVTERSDGYLAMKYEKMVPLLVGAIQDQQKIINEMRAEIDELKSKINH